MPVSINQAEKMRLQKIICSGAFVFGCYRSFMRKNRTKKALFVIADGIPADVIGAADAFPDVIAKVVVIQQAQWVAKKNQ